MWLLWNCYLLGCDMLRLLTIDLLVNSWVYTSFDYKTGSFFIASCFVVLCDSKAWRETLRLLFFFLFFCQSLFLVLIVQNIKESYCYENIKKSEPIFTDPLLYARTLPSYDTFHSDLWVEMEDTLSPVRHSTDDLASKSNWPHFLGDSI